MSSFQAKLGWKRQRKGESKNYRFVTFLPDGLEKIPKKQKKKKCLYRIISSKNRLEKAEKGENKNYRSVSFLHDP